MSTRKKLWIILSSVAFLLLLVFLGWKALWRPSGQDPLAPLEESWELRQKEKQIQALEDEVARLGQELEKKTGEIAELRSRLGQARTAGRPEEKPRPIEQVRPEQKTSPDVKFYRTIRTTSVFEVPSDVSRKLATIPEGTTLRVVGSTDGWLEIRSRLGRPAGFVRKDDAMPMASDG